MAQVTTTLTRAAMGVRAIDTGAHNCYSKRGGNMFEDAATIRKTRKKYNGKMFKSGVDTFRQMAAVEEKALKSGALDRRTKELIALGISISKACYG